jgi:hypothetical protein
MTTASKAPTNGKAHDVAVADVTDWSKVALRRIRWMMTDRLPFGEMTVIDGPGGVGKTTMLIDWAARVTRGDDMPDGTPGTGIPGHVVLIADEDAVFVLKARLLAAGANMAYVHHLAGFDGRRFSMPSDAQNLLAFIREKGAIFTIVDALFSHMDEKLKSNVAEDVRRVLTPLGGIAHLTESVVTATRHWGKESRNAVDRGLGSSEINHVARSVIAVGPDPKDEAGVSIVALAKSNLGLNYRLVPSLKFKLEVVRVRALTDLDEDVDITRVHWLGHSDVTADDLASRIPESAEEKTLVTDCAQRITEILLDGPQPTKAVKKILRSEDFSPACIGRAKRKAGVQSTSTSGFPPVWEWQLVTRSKDTTV